MTTEQGLMRLDAAPMATMTTPPEPPATMPVRLILDLDAAASARLKQAPALADHAQKRPTTRRIERSYWDTADHRIGRMGRALGLQKTGARQVQIMAPIAARRTGGGLAVEDSVTIAGARPDIVRLALTRGADPARIGALDPAAIVPIFALDAKRTRWTVAWHGTTLTVDHDEGTISAPSGHLPVDQLTLCVTAGPPGGLYDFAQALFRDLPFRLADLDAAQLGYRLVAAEDWWPPGSAPALDPDMPTREGVLAIGRAALAQLRTEIARVAAAPEPERIHQARVALRRLRSVLSVFGMVLPDAPRRRLARTLGVLASQFGKAREWDVFLAETLAPIAATLGEMPSLRMLGMTAAVLREQGAAAALAELDTAEFMALSLSLGAWFDAGIWPAEADGLAQPEKTYWLDQPLHDFARHVLRKRHRRLLDTGAALADPRPAELHRLRLEAKKLRYTAEFFAPLFPAKPGKRYIAALRQVQDVLGTLNDAAGVPDLVRRLVTEPDRDGGYAAGIITGWSTAKASAARARFAEAWDTLRHARRFWRG